MMTLLVGRVVLKFLTMDDRGSRCLAEISSALMGLNIVKLLVIIRLRSSGLCIVEL